MSDKRLNDNKKDGVLYEIRLDPKDSEWVDESTKVMSAQDIMRLALTCFIDLNKKIERNLIYGPEE